MICSMLEVVSQRPPPSLCVRNFYVNLVVFRTVVNSPQFKVIEPSVLLTTYEWTMQNLISLANAFSILFTSYHYKTYFVILSNRFYVLVLFE